MRVKTLMRTRFAAVSDDAPLDEARALLAREQVETVPVVREGALVGLLRARDIERLGPSTVPLIRIVVADVMVRDPLIVSPVTPLAEAVRLVRDSRTDVLVVCDQESAIGVLTANDLLRALDRLASAGRSG